MKTLNEEKIKAILLQEAYFGNEEMLRYDQTTRAIKKAWFRNDTRELFVIQGTRLFRRVAK